MQGLSNEEIVSRIRNRAVDEEQKELYAQLYRQNYPIIHALCRKYSRGNLLDEEDLEQEAFIGLRVAIEKFDSKQENGFMTFAETVIKNTLIGYMSQNRSVKVPPYLTGRLGKYNRIIQKVLLEYGREPTDEELCQILDLSPKQVKRLRTASYSAISLDAVSEDADPLIDTIEDPADEIGTVTDRIDFETLREDLWTAVEELDDRKCKAIKLRFMQNKTLKQVGEALGVSEEGARRLQIKALKRLSRPDKLRSYEEDYISSHAFRATGRNAFENSGTSSVERTAINLYELGIEERQRKLDRQIKKVAKKNAVSAEEAFSLYIKEKYADILERKEK